MLNIFQRSYEKNGSFSTPQSIGLLQKWKKINLEVANAKAAELSYQNAEMLYMALSPVARENLSILDNEELAAVQVLIGSMMGIRPRKTKRGPGRPRKSPKVSITTTTTTKTKTTINYDEPKHNGGDEDESDDSSESEAEEEESGSEEEEGSDESASESESESDDGSDSDDDDDEI